MSIDCGTKFFGWLMAILLADFLASPAVCQTAADDPVQKMSPIESLGLTAIEASQLTQAIDARDYITAEKLLLTEIEHDPHSPQAARRLDYAGNVYFLDHDYLNAAIAWKKSEKIAPLEPSLRFSLAMAYIRLGHSDWARNVLESLAVQSSSEALYTYWLGRLDYDGNDYNRAIKHFQHATELAPGMARAYDNLGLCYYYQNENALAIYNYKRAIELEQNSVHPSPWPYLNLAITQQFMNQLEDAEKNLREAIRLDPQLAAARFQLGIVLEDDGRLDAAIDSLGAAARLDAAYPEPHMAMARIYRKLGHEQAARKEAETYQRLHRASK